MLQKVFEESGIKSIVLIDHAVHQSGALEFNLNSYEKGLE